MSNPVLRTIVACTAVAAPALAVDADLRLGPNELTVDVGVFNQHIDQGATRIDTFTAHSEVSARFFGFGLTVDAWMALDDDEGRDLEVGELSEVRARIDYLIEIPEIIQILPHYETSYYPYRGDGYSGSGNQFPSFSGVLNPFRSERWGKEPHWLGVDAWFMLPWEGMEVGGSFDYDIADNVGWRAAVGARQFIQIANLDLATYQVLNYGDDRYHDWLIGVPSAGFTTAEGGITATLPLPVDYLFLYAKGEVHVWLDGEDRDALQDVVEVVGGFGLELRINQLGF